MSTGESVVSGRKSSGSAEDPPQPLLYPDPPTGPEANPNVDGDPVASPGAGGSDTFAFNRPPLSEKEAMTEAKRCLGCADHPCTNACPTAMDVPKFISLISRGDFYGAGKIVFQHNPFALSCGILCPAVELCMQPCKTRDTEMGSIRIGRLQQFAATKLIEMEVAAARSVSIIPAALESERIACIGAGPASMSCAVYLARMGFRSITIFEEKDMAGGTIAQEIPQFRIPQSLLEREIQFVRNMGVKFEHGKALGRDFSIADLMGTGNGGEGGFNAVFVGVGLMTPTKINQIDESSYDRVYTSKDFLRAAANATKGFAKVKVPSPLPKVGGHTVVVGAGDVAVDCALTALRCGAKRVSMVFRRSFNDIRCNEVEFNNLREAGVELLPNCMPLRVVASQSQSESESDVVLEGLEVEISDKSLEDCKYYGTGYKRLIKCDYIITALGSSVSADMVPLIDSVRDTPGVFVGGDANRVSSMIVEAARDGREAAWSIAEFLAAKASITPPRRVPLPFLTTLDVDQPSAKRERADRDIEDLVAGVGKSKEMSRSGHKGDDHVRRVTRNHPVADPPKLGRAVGFKWNGNATEGMEGEMISTSLIAAGHDIFGHHSKDQTPQGIYCANGQCSACEVVVDGVAVKSCMTPLKEGMEIKSGLSRPAMLDHVPEGVLDPSTIAAPREVDVLIIGGGPAGLSAARELGQLGVHVILVDDKTALGGKLVLQTHKFFGSVADTRAGTRGMDIGKQLAEELQEFKSIEVQLGTTVVGVFSDKVVGMQHVADRTYELVKPKKLLVATGSREKSLPFRGNTLPGVYGAGAFQTIVNRDFVRPARRVLIVGGGNVGLITGYHAIQAGIEVVALVEALPSCGGYKVHEDKLRRLGVPIMTRHSILAAHGTDHVTAATICAVNERFQPIAGTEIEYEVDCVLVAVGLAEVNEFYRKAKEWGMDVYSAGDAQAIAEASAAMVTGRIEGLRIARSLGLETEVDPVELAEKAKVLREHGGVVHERSHPVGERGMRPIYHCYQEIPCDVCHNTCTHNLIYLEDGKMTGIPQFAAEAGVCEGCLDCVAACSGLAITLFDSREDPDYPLVTMPFEMSMETTAVAVGKNIPVMGENGNLIGNFMCVDIKFNEKFKTNLVTVQLPRDVAFDAVAVWQQDHAIKTGEDRPHKDELEQPTTNSYVCRCERVTVAEVEEAIKMAGDAADVNQIKAITRLGMGACGGKTCGVSAARIIGSKAGKGKVVSHATDRPLVVEMPMMQLATAPTPDAPASRWPVDKYKLDMQSNRYDVIVMGAGSIGVPIAMSLAAAGKRVVVLDQGAAPGTGDNKHAIGGMRATMSHPAKIVTMLRSLENRCQRQRRGHQHRLGAGPHHERRRPREIRSQGSIDHWFDVVFLVPTLGGRHGV